MTENMQDPLNHPEVQLANGRAYLASFIVFHEVLAHGTRIPDVAGPVVAAESANSGHCIAHTTPDISGILATH